MYKALTIAGSDSSGGAGIQADIKTMTAHGVYAMSAITALTAQNTTGVTGIMEVSPDFLEEQMDCIFTDIEPDAVKIGMVSSEGLICSIAKKLKQYDAKNVVVDPVMVATSGSRLISQEAISVLKEQLFPLADVLTPNIPEAEVIAGIKIETKEDMRKASEIIYNQYGCPVLCKGGHFGEDADDLLYLGDEICWLKGIRFENPNTHGTGCTLSSAIASNLARGYSMLESVQLAKEYVAKAIADNLDIGKGRGPLNHMWKLMQNEENFTYGEEMYR